MIGIGVVSLSSWKERESNITEPISVLDTRRSPSPSTSTSTLSAAVSSELPPPLPAAAFEVVGDDDWEALLSDSGQDPFLFRWISNELTQNDSNPNPTEVSPLSPHSLSNPSGQNPFPQTANSSLQNLNFQNYSEETLDEKPQFFNPFPPISQIPPKILSLPNQPISLKPSNLGNSGNSENFIPHLQTPKLDTQPHSPLKNETLALYQPPLKRPHFGDLGNSENLGSNPQISNYDPQQPVKRPNLGNSGNLRNVVVDPQILEIDKLPPETLPLIPQQAICDQLYKACELILAGNLVNAHSILARLNHHRTPVTNPIQRASFYLSEALLQLPLLGPGSGSPNLFCKSPTPIEAFSKIGAYKLFSEVSPLTHFINFTSNQAILEAVCEYKRIHIVDFDIGSGAQWASFMAELPSFRGTLYLKITAFASPSTHHPFELAIIHENLSQFANEIGINFELEVVNLDSFDLGAYPVHLFKSSDVENETILAVNFPIWAFSNRLSLLPSLIRFVKQLSPKIVVSMERGCERTDIPFSHHILHSLQYHEALLGSIYASKMNYELLSKIEKFVIQPKIEDIVLGRLSYIDQMPHWRALFGAAGFSQINLSNFAEAQAECVIAKAQVRGFRAERRENSLVLSWQGRELVAASAWRC